MWGGARPSRDDLVHPSPQAFSFKLFASQFNFTGNFLTEGQTVAAPVMLPSQ
jgi:hypothetical protein